MLLEENNYIFEKIPFYLLKSTKCFFKNRLIPPKI